MKWEIDFPTNSRIDRNSGKSVVVLGHVLPSKNITFGAVKQKARSSKNILTHWLQSLTKLVSNFVTNNAFNARAVVAVRSLYGHRTIYYY